MEAHLSLIDDAYSADAHSLTGNVIFWSRPGIIFANNAAFDAFTPDQQDLLRRAGVRALAKSVDAIRTKRATVADDVCKRGVKMIDASEGTLAELRAAVEPVYDEIEKDPGTKATIDAIKGTPCQLHCGAGRRRMQRGREFAGSAGRGWRQSDRWDVAGLADTLEELMAAGALEGENRPENAGCGTKTFRKGQFWELRDGSLFDPGKPHGRFTVEGSTVTLTPRTNRKPGSSSGAPLPTR